MVELWHHLWLKFDHVWHKYLTRCDEWTLLGIWLFCSLAASHPPIKTDKCLMEPERLYSVQAFVWTDLHIGLWPDVLGHFELFTLGLGEGSIYECIKVSFCQVCSRKYDFLFLNLANVQLAVNRHRGRCNSGMICTAFSEIGTLHTGTLHDTLWHTAWQLGTLHDS